MGQSVIFHRVGVFVRVFVVNAVHVGRFEDNVRVDFRRAKRRRGIGREERVARAAAENHNSAFFKVANGAVTNVGFGDLPHFNRGLDAHFQAVLFERVGKRQSVHCSREHTDMVRARSVHIAGRTASPEVAAADDEAYLHAEL